MSGSFAKVAPTSSTKVGVLKLRVPENVSKTFRLTITCKEADLSESYTLFRNDEK